MKFDSRVFMNNISISPCKPDNFFVYMTALFLFAAGIAVGKTVPTKVAISGATIQASSTVGKIKAHGRYGAPRWLQQQAKSNSSQTLVADLNE